VYAWKKIGTKYAIINGNNVEVEDIDKLFYLKKKGINIIYLEFFRFL